MKIINFSIPVNKSEEIQSITCISWPLPEKLLTDQISQIFSKLYSQQKRFPVSKRYFKKTNNINMLA